MKPAIVVFGTAGAALLGLSVAFASLPSPSTGPVGTLLSDAMLSQVTSRVVVINPTTVTASGDGQLHAATKKKAAKTKKKKGKKAPSKKK